MIKEETKKPKRENEAIKLLLPKGTYARLQTVAEKQGSKASVMCRMAILEMIRKGNRK
jgi:hypothetical protein